MAEPSYADRGDIDRPRVRYLFEVWLLTLKPDSYWQLFIMKVPM